MGVSSLGAPCQPLGQPSLGQLEAPAAWAPKRWEAGVWCPGKDVLRGECHAARGTCREPAPEPARQSPWPCLSPSANHHRAGKKGHTTPEVPRDCPGPAVHDHLALSQTAEPAHQAEASAAPQTSHLHEEPWVRSFCPASSCAPCLPISCSAPSLVCSHVCSPGPSRRTPLNFPWVLQSEAESLEGSKRPGSTPPAKPASWAPSMAEKLPQLQGPQPS